MEIKVHEIKKQYPKAYKLFSEKYQPSFSDLLDFFDEQGLYIKIIPEFYKDGINWNLQIIWYTDKEKWPETPRKTIEDYITDGTMMYGDNNEFPTRKDAVLAASILAFEILERKLDNNGSFGERRGFRDLNFTKVIMDNIQKKYLIL